MPKPTPPLQGPGLTREDGERLERIATRIGADFDAEFPPHDDARADISFLRQLSQRALASAAEDFGTDGNLRGFHVREGVCFDSDPEGTVYLVLPGPNQEAWELEIAPSEWASVVAYVSKRGEHGGTHREALAFRLASSALASPQIDTEAEELRRLRRRLFEQAELQELANIVTPGAVQAHLESLFAAVRDGAGLASPQGKEAGEGQVERLEKALRFYADHRNYEDGDNEEIPGFGEADVNDDMVWTADAGYTARAALGIQESDRYNEFAEKRIPAEVRDAIYAALASTQPTSAPPQDDLAKALAAFLVSAFEEDFPEGRGLDGESSALCRLTDIAQVIADGGDPESMLAEPGLFEADDRLRAALSSAPPVEEGGRNA